MIFDKKKAKIGLEKALLGNSEQELLAVLKENSFLFYDLYSRKRGIQPNFCEVPFGVKYRCGAGHDCSYINQIAPAAMIFIPSKGGRSHVEVEESSWEDCAKGANVLLQCMLTSADEK
jgi:hypothetical protein